MRRQLVYVDVVMIGRAAYDDPMLFAAVDREFYGVPTLCVDRDEVTLRMAEYAARRIEAGDRLHHVTRHMASLYVGQPGGRLWRRHLSQAVREDADERVILEGLEILRECRGRIRDSA